ncbi:MAG TPA: cobalt ECF transporter T component CbiQ [Chloroflexi bacterium]|nr:cobalt ECF transporter T component CbiQ [Chloroflexota bacterium]
MKTLSSPCAPPQEAPSIPRGRDPRLKVVWTLAFILYALALPDGQWGVFLLSAVGLGGVAMLSGVRWTAMLRRAQVALPFALAAVSTAFIWPGRPWMTFHLGGWTLTVTVEGGIHFLSILLRAWLAAQAIALLGLTTPFPQWLWAFRRLGMPAELTTMLHLMYRYLAVLTAETLGLQRARTARQAAPLPGKRPPGLLWQARVTGHMAGQLFLRSHARAERVYQAMLVRGYRGDWPMSSNRRLTAWDWLLGVLGVAFLLLIEGLVHR